ncbi:MAG: hypothetical protein M9941_14935 [Anaerolineae bacterium]|nr:hypothetical protein [Anaerolineae bacterium]
MTQSGVLMNERRWLALIIGAYVVLGAAMSVIVPLGESPDEIDHFRFIQALLFERALPVMQPTAADNVTMEANQPPLYYTLGALVAAPVLQSDYVDPQFVTCFLFETGAPGRQHLYVHDSAEAFPWSGTPLAFHIVRLFSVALGALTVWLAYKLGRLLAPHQPVIGLLAAALLAFNPQFIFITASVNNDVLTALLGAVIVVVSVQLVVGNRSPDYAGWRDLLRSAFYQRIVLLGVLLGLGALTKLALFALWPVALLAVTGAWAKRKGEAGVGFKELGTGLVLLGVPPLLLAGWWYVRGQWLYGDPLAWDVHLAAKGDSVLRVAPFGWSDLVEFGRIHFQSYWALFGWLNVAWPGWVYWLVGLLVAGGVVGVGRFIAQRRHSWRDLVPLSLTILAVLAVYASLFRYIQTINWSGYQGRLAYAVAAPLAALLALGLVTLFGRMGAVVTAGGMALLATLTLLLVIAPAYPRPLIYEPDATLPRTCIHFSSGFTIEAFAAPAVIRPNEVVTVTLHGYGYTDHPGLPLEVQLVGANGAVLATAEAPSGAWQRDMLNTVSFTVPIPEALAAGSAEWRVSMLREGELLTASDVYGRTLSVPTPLMPVEIEIDSAD